MGKGNSQQTIDGGVSEGGSSPIESEDSGTSSISRNSIDKEAGLATCRVCQCAESDKRGDAALDFLGITPLLRDAHKSNEDAKPNCKEVLKDVEGDDFHNKNGRRESEFVEFVSPKGEVFICSTDIEMGLGHHQDKLVELGCSCKSDLALVHYACALKWFVNHGSTVCEICGCIAKNIRTVDFKKVVGSLKDYEGLRERIVNGEPNPALVQTNSGVDPDAVAAIRRQRLSEISLWFNLHNNNSSAAISHVTEQPSNIVTEEVVPAENPATKWAVEGTGILLATGLLTVTLAWLIAPRVGKKTAKSGLHILLGGICALTVVIFFRFFVLTRIKYGPARYWAILFVFWFLVFGIWASRTHGAHTT
uniref:RING-CH-type domain-containing protein n=1 Tax=Davidia involucrata TaxID=16924 RepID=A0A5B7AVY0_DAVIN